MAIINGTAGNDYIPRGSATLDGGGNVSYEVDDQIYGFAGDDNIGDGAGNNLLYGGDGNDSLVTGHGVDAIYGGRGNDFMSGGVGNDTLYGGDGSDFIWVLNGDGGTEGGSDLVYGGLGNDHIRIDEYGLSTGSVANGGSGTDVLDIRLGDFYLNGVLDRRGYVVDLSQMWSGGVGWIGGTRVTGLEVINGISGSAGSDRIIIGTGYAYSVNQVVNGVLVQNQIRGGEGDDYISGGNGEEHMNGDAGNDTLLGNGGDDNLTGGVGQNYLSGGAGNDVASGSWDLDTLLGGAGNDSLFGNEGNDYLDGGSGNDLLAGGLGDDIFVVDSLFDYLADEGGVDLVKARISFALWLGIENLSLIGPATSGTGNGLANRITGNGANNELFGLEGADTIQGGNGSDLLAGGAGADYLKGEAGADTFLFNLLETDANRDRIADFQTGVDRVAFDRTVFAAFAGDPAGALDPAAFALGAATTADHHVIYNAATGALSYDADGSGAGTATLVAVLNGAPALGAADIWLI